MQKKLFIFLIGLFVFFSFVFFSYFVHKDVFLRFDFDTTVRLQSHIPRRFDTLLSLFSLFGSVEIATVALLLLLILIRKLRGIFLLFTYASIFLFELYGKIFVEHLGPPFMFFKYNIQFFFPSSYVQPGYSYPSGHSARTLFISILAIFLIARNKKLSYVHKLIGFGIIVLFDLIMLISRVYLGEHWATDVIGGGLLGASLGFLSLAFF